jgi:hypothetical protein
VAFNKFRELLILQIKLIYQIAELIDKDTMEFDKVIDFPKHKLDVLLIDTKFHLQGHLDSVVDHLQICNIINLFFEQHFD